MIRFRSVLLLMLVLAGSFAFAADDQAAVAKVVAEHLKVDPAALDLDAPLSEIGNGADALDVVEILMAIDEKLHVDISDKHIEAVVGPNETDDLPAKVTVRKLAKMLALARQK
ncbi:MAG TPA: phosphopantetheine-binding protein [Steroidobacteraceae bacterium]|nr:phosphopantetheine-binding protein [Steroidobacteraceae bacterium]